MNPLVTQTTTNAVIVSVGDGKICLRSLTNVDLVIDLNGWLTTNSTVGLQPVSSRRHPIRSGRLDASAAGTNAGGAGGTRRIINDGGGSERDCNRPDGHWFHHRLALRR